jgi:hypothetical protein
VPSLTASATVIGSDTISQINAAAKIAAISATLADRLTLRREEAIETAILLGPAEAGAPNAAPALGWKAGAPNAAAALGWQAGHY